MEAEPARSGCPINAAVEAFGDSWSLLVLHEVMFGHRCYFRELRPRCTRRQAFLTLGFRRPATLVRSCRRPLHSRDYSICYSRHVGEWEIYQTDEVADWMGTCVTPIRRRPIGSRLLSTCSLSTGQHWVGLL